MRKGMLDFSSPLADLFRRFIAEKQTCGFKATTDARQLHELERWWSTSDKHPELSRFWAEKYLAIRPGESDGTRNIRLAFWRNLAKYANLQGVEAYIPDEYPTHWRLQQYTPYIFTRSEVGALFLAADALSDDGNIMPRKSHSAALLFRLLYGTGMRIGEVLKLQRRNVDLERGLMTIIGGKNLQDRILPLPPKLTERIAQFIHRFPGAADEPVFLSPVRRHAYDKVTIRKIFYNLAVKAELPPRRNGHGPRVHDFRHTFAVHRLEKWYLEGANLNAKLPILSAYLGHASPQETCYYLRLTEALLPEIARRSQNFIGSLLIQEEANENN